MRVYCLIPVHNRFNETKEVLRVLKAQDFPALRVVVVDDGSTDGTAEYIRQDTLDVELIVGDGSLWWSGAMEKGLASILPRVKEGDFVLFLNNDTRFCPDYVTTLVAVSQAYDRAVVGSILMDAGRPDRILSVGPRICYGLTRVEEVYPTTMGSVGDSSAAPNTFPEVVEVDALSGRGTLYPVEVLQRIGTIRYRWLPHYMADYEISARAKAAGFRTLVATRAVVWTDAEASGIEPRRASILQRLFSRRSSSNILDALVFFTLCGPWYWRITGALRVIIFRLWAVLKQYLGVGHRSV